MERISIGIFFLFISQLLTAQSKLVADNNFIEHQGFSLELGATAAAFQDVRFSTVRYFGAGLHAGIGLRKQSADGVRYLGLRFNTADLSTGSNSLAGYKYLRGQISYERQVRLGQLFGLDFLAGGAVDGSLSLFTADADGNNRQRYYTNVALSGLASVRLPLGKSALTIGAGIGLLHWGKDGSSFAFSWAQELLENGEFSYEDDSAALPFGGHKFRFLGEVVQIQTRLGYQLNQRLGLAYNWDLTQYAVVKSYPTTAAQHRLNLVYTF